MLYVQPLSETGSSQLGSMGFLVLFCFLQDFKSNFGNMFYKQKIQYFDLYAYKSDIIVKQNMTKFSICMLCFFLSFSLSLHPSLHPLFLSEKNTFKI